MKTSDPQFFMSNLFPLVDTPYRRGEEPSKRIDIFNPDGARFVNRLEPLSKIPWVERNKPDVIALRSIGTVTAWWTILFYNGEQHPFEIVNGKTITIPNASVTNIVSVNRTSGRGTRVKV